MSDMTDMTECTCSYVVDTVRQCKAVTHRHSTSATEEDYLWNPCRCDECRAYLFMRYGDKCLCRGDGGQSEYVYCHASVHQCACPFTDCRVTVHECTCAKQYGDNKCKAERHMCIRYPTRLKPCLCEAHRGMTVYPLDKCKCRNPIFHWGGGISVSCDAHEHFCLCICPLYRDICKAHA